MFQYSELTGLYTLTSNDFIRKPAQTQVRTLHTNGVERRRIFFAGRAWHLHLPPSTFGSRRCRHANGLIMRGELAIFLVADPDQKPFSTWETRSVSSSSRCDGHGSPVAIVVRAWAERARGTFHVHSKPCPVAEATRSNVIVWRCVWLVSAPYQSSHMPGQSGKETAVVV